MKPTWGLLLFTVFVASGTHSPVPSGISDTANPAWLRYDDGTYGWLTGQGTYRGVWINIQDFIPGMTSYMISDVDIWFYHHATPAWQSSQFYLEIWNGDSSGPSELLDQSVQTAIHCAPVQVDYIPALNVEQNWWILDYSAFSDNGDPTILSDNMQGSISHSFYSDDFQVWEPWLIEGGACNYFIACCYDYSLEPATWSRIKTIF